MAIAIPENILNQELTVELLTNKDLSGIWATCTELAHSMAYPSYFCSGDWLKVIAEKVYSEKSLHFFIVKDKNIVKAVLPIVRKRNSLGGADLHFLGTDFYPDPVGLISAPVDRAKSAAAIKKYLPTVPGWDRFILNWVLEDELVDWELPGKLISIEPFKSLPQNFTVLLGEFKKKKRYNLRALVRNFVNAGGELVISTDKSTHSDFMDDLFSLHKKRATERALESSFTGCRVEAFHRQLICETENARFYALRLHQQVIAVIYGFEFSNRFFYYQVAHDPLFADLSPGSALLYLVIEDCCARGVEEFNFLQGDECYKWIWTDNSRALYQCVLKSGSWRSHLLDALDTAKEINNSTFRWLRHGS